MITEYVSVSINSVGLEGAGSGLLGGDGSGILVPTFVVSEDPIILTFPTSTLFGTLFRSDGLNRIGGSNLIFPHFG